MAYSTLARPGAPARVRTTWTDRDPAALAIPLAGLLADVFPGHLLPDAGGLARPPRGPDRPLQRPDAGPPPPPSLHRHVGVAPLDRPDHVHAPDHGRDLPLRLRRRPRHRAGWPGDPGVGPLR